MNKSFAFVAIVLSLFISSCASDRRGAGKEVSGPEAAVQITSHRGVGTIVALRPGVPSIEINHEDIPDLMPAMEMEFHVKDKSLLDGLEVGNRVEFNVESGVGGLQISAIRKL